MGLNDARAPVRVQMANTWEVAADTSCSHIIEWVAHVAREAPGGRLASLVISCHGAPAYMQLGQGFGMGQVDLFRGWAGLIGKIWIRACLVGRIVTEASASEGDGIFFSQMNMTGNGDAFLRAMGRQTGAHIVASTEAQVSGRYNRTNALPLGKLDTYEGLVLSYPPGGGGASWSHRYPSTAILSPTTGTSVNSE